MGTLRLLLPDLDERKINEDDFFYSAVQPLTSVPIKLKLGFNSQAIINLKLKFGLWGAHPNEIQEVKCFLLGGVQYSVKLSDVINQGDTEAIVNIRVSSGQFKWDRTIVFNKNSIKTSNQLVSLVENFMSRELTLTIQAYGTLSRCDDFFGYYNGLLGNYCGSCGKIVK